MARRRHYPPSQIRYWREHPVVGVRLSRELKEILDRVRGGRSYAELIKEVLNRTYEAYKKGYEDGYKRGYDDAWKVEHFTVPCPICGKPMLFSPRMPNWDEVRGILRNAFRDWRHVECGRRVGGRA